MSTLLFANNATTTLAGNLGTGTTAVPVATGTGALFPAPGAGEYFVVSFFNQTNPALTEICWCTNVTGDILTVVRAREGTVAQTWSIGDIVNNDLTAGQMEAMLQTLALPAATTSAEGVVQLATSAEVTAGTDASKVITPATLTALLGEEFNIGPIYFKSGTTPSLGNDASYGVVFVNAFPNACKRAFISPRLNGSYQTTSDSWVLMDQAGASQTGFTVYRASSANAQALFCDWWAWGI